MFTGLIKDIGIIKSITTNSEGKEFLIESSKLANEIQIDDSIATNGVCLTATEIKNNLFKVQAVHVTLEKTNLGKLTTGSKVNLELALRPIDRIGGHFVQGHVNGFGTIKAITPRGKNFEITFNAPRNLFRYIIEEGSVAIDGISLTVSKLTSDTFSVSIIPHTYQNTVLHTKTIGETVNIEVDMMAKYLENFLKFDKKESKFDLDSWYKEQSP
jgi:riboflavin synthase